MSDLGGLNLGQLRFIVGAFLVLVMPLASLPAAAQTEEFTPPTIESVDPNGVDVVTGDFTFRVVEVAIGPQGAGGLSQARTFRGGKATAYWRDVNSGTVQLNYNLDFEVVAAVVTYDGNSFTFDYNGSLYTPSSDAATTLVKSGQIYTFTSRYGEVVHFSEAYAMHHNWQGNAIVTDITRPNGEVITFHHKYVNNGPSEANRIQSITNNYGYQIHYEYENDNPSTSGYKNRIKVVGINNAYDYCDPLASICSGFTQTWPQVTYSKPSTTIDRVANVLNQNTDYVYTPSGSWKGLTQIKRHSGAVATTIAYSSTTDDVASLTIKGVTYTYGAPVFVSTGIYSRTATPTATGSFKYTYKMTAPSHITKVERLNAGVSRFTSYTRDANGRIISVADTEGRATDYAYDARGNLITITRKAKPGSGLADIVTQAGYAASCIAGNTKFCNKPAWIEDANDYRTEFTYDSAHGGVLTATAPSATGPAPSGSGDRPQTRYQYVAKSARYKTGPSTYTNGSNVTVRNVVRACNSGSSCANSALETVVTTTFQTTSSPNNILPIQVTTAGGDGLATSTVSTSWNALARPSSVDGPLVGSADSTYFQYDALGRTLIAAGPDPDGGGVLKYRARRTTYSTDGFATKVEQGTLTSATGWASFVALGRVDLTYDTGGRVIKETHVVGTTTRSVVQYGYGPGGRSACTAYRMDPATFSSLPSTACLQAGGAVKDRITFKAYNDFDDVIAVNIGYGTAVQQAVQTFTYTASGQVDTLKDAKGNLTKYEYDGFGRLYRTYFPHKTTVGSYSTTDYEQLSYDARSTVTSRRARDGTLFNFTNDNLRRQTFVNAPGIDPDVTFTYDNFGRLITASQSGQTLTYVYDAQGRLASEAGPKGTVSYQYDEAGRRTRMNYPGAGSFYVTYDYNTVGELTNIRELGVASGVGVLATYAYDDWGRRTSLTRGNGVVTTYAFNAAGRLQTLTNNLAGTTDDQTLTLTYNTADQITQRINSNTAYDYTAFTAFTENYASNGLNQITSVAGASVNHDTRGNMTSDGSQSYTFDASNRLKTATGGVTLSYDPVGRLYQVTAGSTTDHLYDGVDLIAEYSSTTVLRRYVHGPGADETLVQYDGTGTATRTFLIADERGSIVAGTNSSGVKTYINRYDEYGRPQSGNAGLFQYTGQIYLGAVGLYHYKARAYHPKLGRFPHPDPVGFMGGMNLYGYAGNDPVNSIDPMGLADENVTVGGHCGWQSYGSYVLCPGDTWDSLFGPGFGDPYGPDWQAIYDRLNPGYTFNPFNLRGGGKDVPPCTYGPSDASGAISAGAFTPAGGGSITTGLDNGRSFVTGRVGYGWGGGVTYNPKGGLPVIPSDPYKGGAMLTLSAQGGFTVGIPGTPVAISFTIEGGANISTRDGMSLLWNPDFEFGWNAKKGVELHGNLGSSFSVYDSSYETITSNGKCRAHY